MKLKTLKTVLLCLALGLSTDLSASVTSLTWFTATKDHKESIFGQENLEKYLSTIFVPQQPTKQHKAPRGASESAQGSPSSSSSSISSLSNGVSHISTKDDKKDKK